VRSRRKRRHLGQSPFPSCWMYTMPPSRNWPRDPDSLPTPPGLPRRSDEPRPAARRPGVDHLLVRFVRELLEPDDGRLRARNIAHDTGLFVMIARDRELERRRIARAPDRERRGPRGRGPHPRRR
jgi:hypothetical protein